MVSGDNLETAIAYAIKAGILTEEESRNHNACLTGEEFRKAVGGLVKDQFGKLILERPQDFKLVIRHLKVVGRAVPYDKHVLATGLKEIGRTVAVTGEGINDVDALASADVGFAMGSGVSVAKDVADMILTDDNFEATMNAAMWGRNIYANVRKFTQFQLTVNFTTLILVFVGAVLKGTPTLNIVQLLWVNLIMDTFAAVALGSEKPHPSIIKNAPFKENEPIITVTMWRQIYGMTAYITAVMIVLFFFVDDMWGLTLVNSDPFFIDGVPSDKCVHYTLLFNTFVFMHLFNEINCRKIGATQFNVFHNILPNWQFMLVVGSLFAMQIVIVQYGGVLTGCAPLTADKHAFCVMIGASVLLVSAILKLTPASWTEKMPLAVDENKPIDENDPILKMYNKQANAKVTVQKKVEDEVYHQE